ncbi:unnamed protein product, partial [Ectocarpus sp. 13 AM-2016]
GRCHTRFCPSDDARHLYILLSKCLRCLPTCDTDIAGSMTCALVGARPTEAQ